MSVSLAEFQVPGPWPRLGLARRSPEKKERNPLSYSALGALPRPCVTWDLGSGCETSRLSRRPSGRPGSLSLSLSVSALSLSLSSLSLSLSLSLRRERERREREREPPKGTLHLCSRAAACRRCWSSCLAPSFAECRVLQTRTRDASHVGVRGGMEHLAQSW